MPRQIFDIVFASGPLQRFAARFNKEQWVLALRFLIFTVSLSGARRAGHGTPRIEKKDVEAYVEKFRNDFPEFYEGSGCGQEDEVRQGDGEGGGRRGEEDEDQGPAEEEIEWDPPTGLGESSAPGMAVRPEAPASTHLTHSANWSLHQTSRHFPNLRRQPSSNLSRPQRRLSGKWEELFRPDSRCNFDLAIVTRIPFPVYSILNYQ